MAVPLLFVALVATIAVPAATPATPPKATLATFAGEWSGHTRFLEITRFGRAVEHVGDGCCHPIYDLTLRLSSPRGTTRDATVTAKVLSVRIHDRGFARSHPALKAGAIGRLRLKNGVVTNTLTGIYYCNEAAGRKGICGA